MRGADFGTDESSPAKKESRSGRTRAISIVRKSLHKNSDPSHIGDLATRICDFHTLRPSHSTQFAFGQSGRVEHSFRSRFSPFKELKGARTARESRSLAQIGAFLEMLVERFCIHASALVSWGGFGVELWLF